MAGICEVLGMVTFVGRMPVRASRHKTKTVTPLTLLLSWEEHARRSHPKVPNVGRGRATTCLVSNAQESPLECVSVEVNVCGDARDGRSADVMIVLLGRDTNHMTDQGRKG